MGADYIPEDNIIARCNKAKTKKLIEDCVEANFNSIRLWGGGYYAEDYFYDLCDEYGLIIWHDHLFACAVYDFNDEFKENITEEIIQNTKRIRHHASLGLWCGNNEMETAWVDWGIKDPLKFKADYIKQFEVLMPEISKAVDPNTFYWLASPSSTGSFDKPNDENYGDMHDWSIWHGRKPFTDYRNRFPRFMSEFGIQSFPSNKTIESFTLPEDRNLFSYVMENHEKQNVGIEIIVNYISQYFKFPKDFSNFAYVSQLIQAEGLRYGVEHWRRNRGRCMGAIYWQLNDCWPVISWASIDYYGRWKALHYAAKKFFSPVLLSACEEGTKVSLHLSNESLNKVSGKVVWKLRDSHSNILCQHEQSIHIEELTSKEIVNLDFAKELDSKKKMREHYLEYSLFIDDKNVSSETALFVPAKHFNFKPAKISYSLKELEDRFLISLSSDTFAKFVELDFKSLDGIFSDNYFDLSANEMKNIEILKSKLSKDISIMEFEEELQIKSLVDSY